MIYSFEPIVDDNCKILILGTMPGAQSLQKQEYYGNRQNTLWRLIYGIFGEMPSEVYEEKKAFLLSKHIALWDVLKACEREGSGDAEIRNEIPNDFKWFFNTYTGIRNVYFNGGNAEKLFKRHVLKSDEDLYNKLQKLNFYRLPSTSPAHATSSYDSKFNKWKVIKDDLSRLQML